ncbi:hypothetical protein NHQ30_005311 [Ciborinia camelliae]|nr:hypothetical protein NHQ30_005311 [Ciborinia camelliae]
MPRERSRSEDRPLIPTDEPLDLNELLVYRVPARYAYQLGTLPYEPQQQQMQRDQGVSNSQAQSDSNARNIEEISDEERARSAIPKKLNSPTRGRNEFRGPASPIRGRSASPENLDSPNRGRTAMPNVLCASDSLSPKRRSKLNSLTRGRNESYMATRAQDLDDQTRQSAKTIVYQATKIADQASEIADLISENEDQASEIATLKRKISELSREKNSIHEQTTIQTRRDKQESTARMSNSESSMVSNSVSTTGRSSTHKRSYAEFSEASTAGRRTSIKKRSSAEFSEADQSKSVRSWQNFVAARSSIMQNLIPHGANDNPTAFQEISECFLTGRSTNAFQSFSKINSDSWYCLRGVLSRGLFSCKKIDDRTRRCEICTEADESSTKNCVQVKSFGSVVTFRIVDTSEM